MKTTPRNPIRLVLLGSCIAVLLTTLAGTRASAEEVTIGGDRPAQLYIPEGYDPATPTPILFLLHPTGGWSGQRFADAWQYQAIGDAYGMLVCFPNGMPRPNGNLAWNASDACCAFGSPPVDDVAYLVGLVDKVSAGWNVDPERVYFHGWSNGAFMAHRMACEAPDRVTAIFAVAGVMPNDPADCTPDSPVHVLHLHGTADTVISYDGGSTQGGTYPSALTTATRWAEHNGCTGGFEALRPRDWLDNASGFETERSRSVGCPDAGEVELWTLQGVGHGNWGGGDWADFAFEWLLAKRKSRGFETRFIANHAGLDVFVDARESSAPDGLSLAEYRWDFGDGTTGTGPRVLHSYEAPGEYVIRLQTRATDGIPGSPVFKTVRIEGSGDDDLTPWTTTEIGASASGSSARRIPGTSEAIELASFAEYSPGTEDELFFLSRQVKSEFDLTARFIVSNDTPAEARVGLTLRESDEPGARAINVALRRITSLGDPVRAMVTYRTETNGPLLGSIVVLSGPIDQWLRLQRSGSTVTASVSSDHETWAELFSLELTDLDVGARAGAFLTGFESASTVYQSAPAIRARLESLHLEQEPDLPSFLRGDADSSGVVDFSDPVHHLKFLLLGEGTILCDDAADADDSGELDFSDDIFTLKAIFLGNVAFSAPGMKECGVDATDDALGCATYETCP